MVESNGKVAIVTGAAGGVGLATVAAFRAQGHRVVAVDRSDRVLDAFADDDGVIPLIGDVSLPATSADAVDLAVDRFGTLDILVNNAGRFLRKPIGEIGPEEWDDLMRVNVKSVYLFSKAVLPILVAKRAGSIVNLGSISGLTGSAGQTAYAATKGAIIAFTRALAIEHAASGVRVNALAPGAIRTDFVRESLGGDDASMRANDVRVQALHPLGRIAEPHEIAAAIVYLSSDAAAFITGAVLPIDGGLTAQ